MADEENLAQENRRLTYECLALITQNRALSQAVADLSSVRRQAELKQMQLVLSRNTWRAQVRVLKEVLLFALQSKEVHHEAAFLLQTDMVKRTPPTGEKGRP